MEENKEETESQKSYTNCGSDTETYQESVSANKCIISLNDFRKLFLENKIKSKKINDEIIPTKNMKVNSENIPAKNIDTNNFKYISQSKKMSQITEVGCPAVTKRGSTAVFQGRKNIENKLINSDMNYSSSKMANSIDIKFADSYIHSEPDKDGFYKCKDDALYEIYKDGPELSEIPKRNNTILKKGLSKFAMKSLEQIVNMLPNEENQNLSYHEMIRYNCSLYADLENPKGKDGHIIMLYNNVDDMINKFIIEMEKIFKKIKVQFMPHKLTIHYDDSGKVSAHVIYNNNYVFDSILDQKIFWKKCISNYDLPFIDIQVYDKDSTLRTLHSVKGYDTHGVFQKRKFIKGKWDSKNHKIIKDNHPISLDDIISKGMGYQVYNIEKSYISFIKKLVIDKCIIKKQRISEYQKTSANAKNVSTDIRKFSSSYQPSDYNIPFDEFTFDDYDVILDKLNTVVSSDKKCVLDDKSLKVLIQWSKETIIMIKNSGDPFFLVKERIIDKYNRKVKSHEWIGRDKTKLVKITDYLNVDSKPYLYQGSKIKTLGKFIDYCIDEKILTRYNKYEFTPYGKVKPYTYSEFSTYNYIPSTEPVKNTIDITKTNIWKWQKDIFGKHFEYQQNWIAQGRQRPDIKPDVCFVLYSETQGVGKGLYYKFNSKIYQEQYCMKTSQLENYFSRFNEHQINKLYVVFEETKSCKAKKFSNLIKNMIDAPNFRAEIKGGKVFWCTCYKRFMIFTNERDCIEVEKTCRRFYMIECNDHLVNNRKFFDQLVKELENPKIINAFRYHYDNLDLSEYNPRNIPETMYKTQQRLINLKSSYKFILNLLDLHDTDSQFSKNILNCAIDLPQREGEESEDGLDFYDKLDFKYDYEFSMTELYNLYREFCTDTEKRPMGKEVFQLDMESIGIKKSQQFRASGSIKYTKGKRIKGYKIINSEITQNIKNKFKNIYVE